MFMSLLFVVYIFDFMRIICFLYLYSLYAFICQHGSQERMPLQNAIFSHQCIGAISEMTYSNLALILVHDNNSNCPIQKLRIQAQHVFTHTLTLVSNAGCGQIE